MPSPSLGWAKLKEDNPDEFRTPLKGGGKRQQPRHDPFQPQPPQGGPFRGGRRDQRRGGGGGPGMGQQRGMGGPRGQQRMPPPRINPFEQQQHEPFMPNVGNMAHMLQNMQANDPETVERKIIPSIMHQARESLNSGSISQEQFSELMRHVMLLKEQIMMAKAERMHHENNVMMGPPPGNRPGPWENPPPGFMQDGPRMPFFMGPNGPMEPMGPNGPMDHMGPMGPNGPMEPMGPMGPMRPMGPHPPMHQQEPLFGHDRPPGGPEFMDHRPPPDMHYFNEGAPPADHERADNGQAGFPSQGPRNHRPLAEPEAGGANPVADPSAPAGPDSASPIVDVQNLWTQLLGAGLVSADKGGADKAGAGKGIPGLEVKAATTEENKTEEASGGVESPESEKEKEEKKKEEEERKEKERKAKELEVG